MRVLLLPGPDSGLVALADEEAAAAAAEAA
jgi:hypothetical protein